MYKEVTIRKIGNSLGTTIPKKMLERHRLSQGDKVYIVETEQGLLITPYDPDFAKAMALSMAWSRDASLRSLEWEKPILPSLKTLNPTP